MCLVLKESKFSIVAKIFSRILYKYPTVLGDFELLRTVTKMLSFLCINMNFQDCPKVFMIGKFLD